MAALIAVVSTAYCLSGTMADGTGVRAGSVAHNGYPLGTKLYIAPSPTGRRRWTVRDRIGYGTDLDFWLPSCTWAIAWGRREVQIRVGWPRKVGTVTRRRSRLSHKRSEGRGHASRSKLAARSDSDRSRGARGPRCR